MFKTNLKDIFKILNELIEATRMAAVERILIRQNKDFYDLFAIHLSLFIKTIVVFDILLFFNIRTNTIKF